jgi:regulator of sigma E protease
MNLPDVGLKLWDLLAFTIVPFVVVLGLMITVHELGHFLAARAVGIRVLAFKIGFGKALWTRKRGHTEYSLGWAPIGGYVRLFGDPSEVEGEDADTPLTEIPEEDKKEALQFQPAHYKLLTFFAGPIMNIVLALVLAPIPFMLGVSEVPPVAGPIEAGSPAAVAGIQTDDRILSIGGKPIASFMDVRWEEAIHPNKTVSYEVQRKDQKLAFDVTLRTSDKKTGPVGESGIKEPDLSSAIGSLVPGSPAAGAGLKPGDTIVEINGAAIRNWDNLTNAVTQGKGEPLAIVVTRAGQSMTFTATPKLDERDNRYRIGISPVMVTEIVNYGPVEASIKGVKFCADSVAKVYVSLWLLISGQISPKLMSGPLGIGAITSQAAHSGIAALLSFVVLISINLGILNLLPIPALDGGHILFTVVETITRRELKMEYKEWIFRVGFFLVIGLVIAVTIQDVIRYKGDMWQFIREIGKGLGIG